MKFLQKYFAALSGFLAFIIYLTTLAPSVVQIDSGELTTVQATLGIAHPTGYPLFTIIGYLFSLIPLPFTKVYQLNLLTAIWCSLGIGFFVYTSKLILDNTSAFSIIKRKEQKKDRGKTKQHKKDSNSIASQDLPEIKKILASVFGGFLLAFSQTYWLQSTSVEVYSLQILLVNLIILFTVKAYIFQKTTQISIFKNPWVQLAVLLALGFSNHMTTLFLLPGIAFLYFDQNKFSKSGFIKIGIMLLVFFPILILLYSYLPFRAQQNPILNWGNPTNLERLIRHIEGKQYQVWLFSSTAAAKQQFLHFINTLPDQFNIGLFICVVGLFGSFMKAKKFFYYNIINLLFTLLYSINYDIHDIDSYFLISYISLGFFAVFGVVQLLSTLKFKKHPYLIPSGVIALFIFVEFYFNYSSVNQSDDFLYKDYTSGILNSVSKNALIISYQWDYFVSPSYYFQYVENYRPDVTIVDKELLRRSWYYHQLSYDHPILLSGMQDDVNSFLKAVAPFEEDKTYNPRVLEIAYRNVLTDLVASNIGKRDVYIAPELFEKEMRSGEFSLPPGFTLVPDLFLFRVVNTKKYVPAGDPNFKFRVPKFKDAYVYNIENFVGSMLARRALYEMQFDKVDRAKIYIKKIKEILPDYKLPSGLDEVLER